MAVLQTKDSKNRKDDLVAAWLLRTTKAKILARLERILHGEIVGVLRVLAVNAVPPFHRQDAKDAK